MSTYSNLLQSQTVSTIYIYIYQIHTQYYDRSYSIEWWCNYTQDSYLLHTSQYRCLVRCLVEWKQRRQFVATTFSQWNDSWFYCYLVTVLGCHFFQHVFPKSTKGTGSARQSQLKEINSSGIQISTANQTLLSFLVQDPQPMLFPKRFSISSKGNAL